MNREWKGMSLQTDLVLYEKVKNEFYKLREKVASKHERGAELTIRADTRMIDLQLSEATLGPMGTFRVYSDERDMREDRMGKGPYPIEYFLASLAFCVQTQLGRHAACNSVVLRSVRCVVVGKLDSRGLYGIEGFKSKIKRIELRLILESEASRQMVRKVIELTHKTCPIYNTLRGGTEVKFSTYLNGERLKLGSTLG